MNDHQIVLAMDAKAEADVVRACCGGDHEFGECPLAVNQNESEED